MSSFSNRTFASEHDVNFYAPTNAQSERRRNQRSVTVNHYRLAIASQRFGQAVGFDSNLHSNTSTSSMFTRVKIGQGSQLRSAAHS
jgi:hypothetical protein